MERQDEAEFMRQRQLAVERMREMSGRSQNAGESHNMPPVPPFVRVNAERERTEEREAVPEPERKSEGAHKPGDTQRHKGGFSIPLLGDLKLPFLSELKTDGDIALILGLMLILFSEKADKKLLFALLYILM